MFARQRFFGACAVAAAVEWRELPWAWIAAVLAAAVALFKSGAWWGSAKVGAVGGVGGWGGVWAVASVGCGVGVVVVFVDVAGAGASVGGW